MSRSYGEDLRVRVIAAVRRGLSTRIESALAKLSRLLPFQAYFSAVKATRWNSPR